MQDRYSAEVSIRGSVGYTTTWGSRSSPGGVGRGNEVNIWNVAGASPVLVDSLIVSDASTLGDIQVSDDGKLLVVATEFAPGSIVIYDLTNPLKPQLLSRFSNGNTAPGVHTAEVQRVNGTLYAFLSIDPSGSQAARLVIVNLSNPAAPAEVFSQTMGNPYVHDVYVRDGILMTALWNDGISIFDIGGGGKGGSVANPVLMGNAKTVGGKVHNIWWYHDAAGNKRYAFVGEEGPGSIGSSAVGDIHVVDVSNLTAPREVAFFDIPGAGTHNFSVDETRGILYAAFYNAGVIALDVRGDLGTCDAAMKSPRQPLRSRQDVARAGGWISRMSDSPFMCGAFNGLGRRCTLPICSTGSGRSRRCPDSVTQSMQSLAVDWHLRFWARTCAIVTVAELGDAVLERRVSRHQIGEASLLISPGGLERIHDAELR